MQTHRVDSWIPPQQGRRALITGANSGIGFPVALALARHGASVVVAARDRTRGEDAVARIRRDVPSAEIEFSELDLASLASIRAFAARELARATPLDLLINNAGVYAPSQRRETADHFELQFGTNVLGHFALTGLLLPALERAAANSDAEPPRIVTVASIAHKVGKLNFADLQSNTSYSPSRSYQQSKLADLILAFELDRRLRERGSRILSIAAHPGVANTNLFQAGQYNAFERAMRTGIGKMIGLVLNDADKGALPTIYAATAQQAVSGGYYGPQSFFETRGSVVGSAKVASQARDQAASQKLWTICEDLTGVPFLDNPVASR